MSADANADGGDDETFALADILFTSGTDLHMQGIRIDLAAGEISTGGVGARMDVWHHWLSISRSEVGQAEAALDRAMAAIAAGDEITAARRLEDECRHGMVAVTAAAIALDAFYASLKQRNGPHPDEAAWRQRLAAGVKPHPRHWQIAETLIGAWSVRNPAAAELRRRVKQLFILRDLAVHPPANVSGFPLRKDINRRMEWRFSAYGAENARKAFAAAEQLIEALLRDPARAPVKIAQWVTDCRDLFESAVGHPIRE